LDQISLVLEDSFAKNRVPLAPDEWIAPPERACDSNRLIVLADVLVGAQHADNILSAL